MIGARNPAISKTSVAFDVQSLLVNFIGISDLTPTFFPRYFLVKFSFFISIYCTSSFDCQINHLKLWHYGTTRQISKAYQQKQKNQYFKLLLVIFKIFTQLLIINILALIIKLIESNKSQKLYPCLLKSATLSSVTVSLTYKNVKQASFEILL